MALRTSDRQRLAVEPFQQVLLNVWQEACRHIDISQSTANIAAMLVRHIPVEQVLVRRIDAARSLPGDRGRWTGRPNASPARRPHRLLAGRTRIAAGVVPPQEGGASPGRSVARRSVGPSSFSAASTATCWPGRWAIRRGTAACWCFWPPPGAPSSREHAELAQLLLEPFSVALENDLRLREMAALREAAEADKRSLLTRLGRKTLGDTIVGVDSGLRAVMERVELVARSDAPVLIFGETGTGKELVARAIHNRSARHNGPFDRVNCGAIPPELIDSQLFGHERGAFTGAVEGRRGWFERADGGTLFLDEIGELPLAAQVRMLRILQDGWMERVGGEKPINVDVRIVAATHRDLAVDGGRRTVPRGPVVSDRRVPDRAAAVARAARGHRRAGRAFRPARGHAVRAGAGRADAGRPDAADVVSLAGKRPRAGGGDRSGGDPRRRQAAGGGHGAGHRRRIARTKPRPTVALALGAAVQLPPQPQVTATSIEPLERRPSGGTSRRRWPLRADASKAARAPPRCLQINPHTLRAKMRKLGIDWARFRDAP